MPVRKKGRLTQQQASSEDIAAVGGLVNELLNATKRDRGPRELSVGIRNVSSETIWLPKQFNDPEITLHPTPVTGDDPHAVAVVSYASWQAMRKGKIVGQGMIVRDDSILGEVDTRGPEDKPGDLHPDHLKNLVRDPHAWIQSKDEAELRAGVAAMTSESSLRRLWAAVDAKIGELERHVSIEERRGKMSPGIKKAIASLPMKYRLLEQLVEERLYELTPLQREIPDRIRV